MSIGFFSVVEGRGCFTWADRYLNIPMRKQQKFQYISGSLKKIESKPQVVSNFEKIITVIKVISYFISFFIFPLIALIIKLIGRFTLKTNRINSTDANSLNPVRDLERELVKLKEALDQFSNFDKLNSALRSLKNGGVETPVLLQPPAGPFVEGWLAVNKGQLKGYFDPIAVNNPWSSDEIIRSAKHAFSLGYSVWALPVIWEGHVRCLAMDVSGRVRLIEPLMGYQNRNRLNQIINKLNSGKIKNKQQKEITFYGEDIVTALQEPGCQQCSRLSLLYAYGIAISGDIDGWQKVHGALLDQTLDRVNQLNNIRYARSVRELPRTGRDLYRNFLASLYCRSYGFNYDHWRAIKLNEILLILNEDRISKWAALEIIPGNFVDDLNCTKGLRSIQDQSGRWRVKAVDFCVQVDQNAPILFNNVRFDEEVIRPDMSIGDILSSANQRVYLIEKIESNQEKRRFLIRVPYNVKIIQGG